MAGPENVGDDRSAMPFDLRAGGGRDDVLDGLRAVAVLGVVLAHAVLLRFGPELAGNPPWVRDVVAVLGSAGVRVFFLISGYVITRLLSAEHRARGSISLMRFYVRRSLRIVPPFAVYLGAVLACSHAGFFYVPRGEYVAAAAFLCNTGLRPCGWFVGHSWSLAVEEQFYLLWPVLVALVKPPRLTACLLAVVVGLVAVGLVRGGGSFANEVSFAHIAIGALAASSRSLQGWIIRRTTPLAWLACAGAYLGVSLRAVDALATVTGPLLLAVVVFGAGNVAPVAASLRSRPFQVLGGCSYSLYLWQELFLGPSWSYFGAPPPLWLLPLAIWLSRQWIERPGIALGRRLAGRQAAVDGDVPAEARR